MDQVKVQFSVIVSKPSPVKDRAVELLWSKFPSLIVFTKTPNWLTHFIFARETRTFYSPCYEAKVPPITQLQTSSIR